MNMISLALFCFTTLLGGALSQETLYVMGGGLSEGAAHATTKAMDVSGQDGRCEEIYDLPHQVFAPMGARTGGRPVVCGGEDTIGEFKDCYIYQILNDTWDHFAPMRELRQSATSVQLSEDDFWFAGGLSVEGAHMKNTEIYVSVTGQFEYGPDLPYGVEGHCMAKINDTHFIMSGGRTDIDNKVTTKAMLYDMDTNVWTEVANMAFERTYHSCGVIVGEDDVEFIVAGGLTENEQGTRLDAEKLTFSTMTFNKTTNLPTPISGGTSTPYRDTFLVTGGFDQFYYALRAIYEWDPVNDDWIERPQKMNVLGRGFHGAVVVDAPGGPCFGVAEQN